VEIPRRTLALDASTKGQFPVEQVMGAPAAPPSTLGQYEAAAYCSYKANVS
jgi:hypothetical protein